jgi:hypothetical protein
MNQSFAYLPQNERKKILLICDDIRVHSGVATVARELVLNTAQHFNWVNVGGAINHPEQGKRLDLSSDTNNNTGLTDASIILYPTNGYGDANLLIQDILFGCSKLKMRLERKCLLSILTFGMTIRLQCIIEDIMSHVMLY